MLLCAARACPMKRHGNQMTGTIRERGAMRQVERCWYLDFYPNAARLWERVHRTIVRLWEHNPVESSYIPHRQPEIMCRLMIIDHLSPIADKQKRLRRDDWSPRR